MPIAGFFRQIFQRIFKKSEEKVELHEKRLLITFWRRGVRKSIMDHFVAVIMYLLHLFRNNVNCWILYIFFGRIFQESEEKVELHEEALLIAFWIRRVRKSMIAHFVAVIMYLLHLFRNKVNCWILYIFFREFSKRVKKKSNFMKNFVNNFLTKTS